MGNACGGSLRSKYLHSFKHAASQRHDSDYNAAAPAADSPKKPFRPATPPAAAEAAAATTDAYTPPVSAPPAAMRRGGAGAPTDLGSVLGHPTPNLRDLYTLSRKLGQGQFGTTYLCTELATGVDYACKSISKRKLITKEDIEDVRREIQIMHHL